MCRMANFDFGSESHSPNVVVDELVVAVAVVVTDVDAAAVVAVDGAVVALQAAGDELHFEWADFDFV